MNAILQCLLNIRLFSDELLGLFLLMKKNAKYFRKLLASPELALSIKKANDLICLIKLEETNTLELDTSLTSEMNGDEEEGHNEHEVSSLYK